MNNPIRYWTILLFISISYIAYSQSDSVAERSSHDLTNLSFEELMNVSIISASRSTENAFDAPISSFVITRKEILNAGATSIPEALRLCPGLFVKQMSNGVYDVTIRGLDNVPSHQYMNVNTLTLVMINNRPVFQYITGGTFWQNIPIEVIDVHRIEVVLGPSAPLYGPNAVTGVINIITRSDMEENLMVKANVQGGDPGTVLSQLYASNKINKRWAVSGSFHHQYRERAKIEYFDRNTGSYTNDLSQIIPDDISDDLIPRKHIALDKVGANVDLSYTNTHNVDLHFSSGYNKNSTWYGLINDKSFSYLKNESIYGMVRGKVKGFSVLGSVVRGTQGTAGNIQAYRFNYQNTDLYADYDIALTQRFNVRPAVHLQHTLTDDTPYTRDQSGVYNARAILYNIAASLKAEYAWKKVRAIAALRVDKFKYPEDLYFSYQGILNYKINKQNIVRAVIARSNSSSFFVDSYVNALVYQIPASPPDNPYSTEVWLRGTKSKALVTNDVIELGYKMKLRHSLYADVAFFRQDAQGFSANILHAPVPVNSTTVVIEAKMQNLDVRAIQHGVTVSLQWVSSNRRFNVRPFVTLQKTAWKDYSPYYDSYEMAADKNYTVESTHDVTSKATPGVYGGFYANYQLGKKWNINLNGTYMSRYEMHTVLSTLNRPYDEFPQSKMGNKFIVNAKVGYQINPRFSIFLNARNFLNANRLEFFAGDEVTPLYLAGIHVQL